MNGTLFFAFLSILIIYKLFKSFGQVQKTGGKQFESILKDKMVNISKNTEENINILKLQEVCPEYTTKDIKHDLELMFTSIFEAFVESKYEELKTMLSANLYESFSEQIHKREEKNLRQEFNIKSVTSDIVGISIADNKIRLSVLFKTSQMSATVNSEGVSFDIPPDYT